MGRPLALGHSAGRGWRFWLRFVWVLAVPTVPVGDFATYRESANYLLEFGSLDHGFIYMPGFVLMLAGVASLGGELLAQKMIGVVLGGLAAAAIFGITARAGRRDRLRPRRRRQRRDGAVALCPCPTAVIATLLYALWPAGVALASVVGTDVPAAALILLALWALVAWGERRPIAAALGFGALMGLAAYVRAVALPLTLMSVVYWAVRRGRARAGAQVALLTALTTAATLVVLLPWAMRNQRAARRAVVHRRSRRHHRAHRRQPQLRGDVHARAESHVQGSDRPHGARRAARARPIGWRSIWPRTGRASSRVTRWGWRSSRPSACSGRSGICCTGRSGGPGVLVGRPSAGSRRAWNAANEIADAFWYALCALFAAGVALAVAERRSRLLALIPFQLALTATYTAFFAEPRYRMPIEMMAFPLVAFALQRVWTLGARRVARTRARPARAGARLGLAVIVAPALFVVAPAISMPVSGCAPRTAGRRRSGSSTARRGWRSGGATAWRAVRRRCRARRTACG